MLIVYLIFSISMKLNLFLPMITLIVWKRLSLAIAYHDKRMINSLYFSDNPSKICKNMNIHNFPNFLLRHGMNPRSWCLHPEGIHPDISYYLHSGQDYLILYML